ncbi:hypothetical protein [Wenzhouxiangella sp. EGI_FJ10409]|uniref:hypothetical protein n=1 Tax=Wenzhouxiangella sp. EGI_FJ10409 TaxID=3243767 RepID=UPI0035D8F4AD
MNNTIRILVTAFAAVAVYFLAYWLPLLLVAWEGYLWLAPFVALLCAIAAGRYVWRSLGPEGAGGPLPSMLIGASVLGGLGFVIGFFGPLILAPEANQGPLLGIFITGPLGIVLGAVAGFFYGLRRGGRG